MPARSIGTATISFGLVSVPVNIYTSSESTASVSFHLLHKKCGTRLKQQYVCPKDNEIVARDEMVKGYEFSKDQYAVFSPDEIKALEERATNTIEISEFVPLAKVDRIYLEKVSYLGPDKGGDRAYRLLTEALQETGRAALGQFAARGKQYLVLLRPMDGMLVMDQLHYQDEIKPAAEIPLGGAEVKPAELQLAKQLIEQSATDEFHPEKYHDHARERTLQAIQQKVEGQEITAEPAQDRGGKIIDLMEALKASLSTTQDKGAEEGEKKTRSKRKAS